ncbi:TPA: TnpV protein, partial [Streptococcus suis]|nr:TnpV protein [Streptococcus suis]
MGDKTVRVRADLHHILPCLTVPAEEEQPIGIWGQRHLDYLKHHCKVTYTNLLTSGRL